MVLKQTDKASLEMLEFPKIRDILAQYTSFPVSHDLALNLEPSTDAVIVQRWLKQSSEAGQLLSLRPNLSVGEVHDIREAVVLAAKGKILEPQILNEIKDTLAASRKVNSSIGKLASEVPSLWDIAKHISGFEDIEKEIGRCITENGDIPDTASEKLRIIRRQLKDSKQKLLDKLDNMLKSKDKQKFIQEPYVTERENRYVIPVRAEFKKDMHGIVHDVSNTGATVFIEPWETVDLGNELRQLSIEEKQEVERILAELSTRVGSCSEQIGNNLEILAEVDLILAKARYAENMKAVIPGISSSTPEPEQGIIKLVNARHPLLKGNVVPLTIEIGKDFNILIITGPNAGGKTVALKTIGLLTLMTQAGIPIPASEESILPVFNGIFADIGDQQSIEQTLSTFSWHISNIVHIIENSDSNSLVLLDELGISTDPEEGSALARAILLNFRDKRTLAVATTHYNDLKVFAHVTKGMSNASMDFQPTTLMPTYKITMGIPGRSNALSVAANMGLPEKIIDNARGMIGKSTAEIEILLADLRVEKQKYESLIAEVESQRNKIAVLKNQVEEDNQRLRQKEHKLFIEVSDSLARETAGLQNLIREVESELRKSRKRQDIERAKQAAQEVQKKIDAELTRAGSILDISQKSASKISLNVVPGDIVRLRNGNIDGNVISVDDDNKKVTIQAGRSKLTVGIDEIDTVIQSQKEMSLRFPVLKKRRSNWAATSTELDLRGKRAEEIENILDRFLNDVFLSNLKEVRIVHGYATGTVRQIVRGILTSHPLVKTFRPGGKDEGGDGVTIASL